MPAETLGDMIQEARISRYKLREFARILGISPTHLSDVENNRRAPSESLLIEIAQYLDLGVDELIVATGRIPEDTKRYAQEVPEAVSLFRKISNRELNPEELNRLKLETDRIVKKRKGDE